MIEGAIVSSAASLVAPLAQELRAGRATKRTKEQLRRQIGYEAAENFDLLQTVSKLSGKQILEKCPTLLLELETSTRDLLVYGGVDASHVLSGGSDLARLWQNVAGLFSADKVTSKTTRDRIAGHSELALYEYYTRRIRLIQRVVRSDAGLTVSINLRMRLNNVQIAAELLSRLLLEK